MFQILEGPKVDFCLPISVLLYHHMEALDVGVAPLANIHLPINANNMKAMRRFLIDSGCFVFRVLFDYDDVHAGVSVETT